MPAGHILVVEDNVMQSKLVSFLLQEAGYTVRVAASAEEAIEILRSFQPQLILMDLQLPGIDGLELTRRLRFDAVHSDTVIVALTAYTDPSDLHKTREAGCDGHIPKPIDPGTFVQLVQEFSNGAHPHVPADGHDLLAELRNSFLAEGLEQCDVILKDLQSGPGCALEAIQRVVHRWMDVSETLGFPGIVDNASRVSELLDHPHSIDNEAEQGFQTAKRLFRAAMHSKAALPAGLVAGLRGVRIGLAGLSEAEIDRIRSLAERTDTKVVLEAIEGRWIENENKYDALVIRERTSRIVALSSELKRPVVLITGHSALQSLATLPAGPFDFLISPWDAEELFLRVYRLVAKPVATVSAGVPPKRRPRVLIVDDDPSIVALVSHALQISEMDCDIARSGQEALNAVRLSPPDAMILDVNLLDLDGFEVLKRIRQNLLTRDLPVLLLTGRHQQSDVAQGFGCGANDYVIKPFKPTELANRLERIISAPARTAR